MFHGKHLKIGEIGEEIASKYLLDNGYYLIIRNYRLKFGEIDIIGKDKDGVLVFFEVKTMKFGMRHYIPEDNMTMAKINKMKRACIFFANSHPETFDDEHGWRMDLISVMLESDPCEKEPRILHYRNI